MVRLTADGNIFCKQSDVMCVTHFEATLNFHV